MKKFKTQIFAVIISFLLVVVITLSYLVYYLTKQNEVVIIPEKYFHISVKSDEDIEVLAKRWVEEYVAQYTQKYVKNSMAIKDIKFDNIEILDKDKNIVRVDFTIDTISKNTNFFQKWGSRNVEDNKISCWWVMYMEVSPSKYANGKMCYLSFRENPAGYDIGIYNTSGQAQYDNKYYSSMNKKKYEDKFRESTYKIQNGSIYLTYDKSVTWLKLDLKELNGLIKKDTYELKNGLYQIDSKLTYICNKNKIVVSTDKGSTWSTIEFNKQGDITYVYLENNNTAYIVVNADCAMGRYAPVIYKTQDAGKNFESINNVERIGWLGYNSSFKAFNTNLVYLVNNNVSGTNATLLVSFDGFNNFGKVILPEQKLNSSLLSDYKWFDIFDTPEMPVLENGILTLIIGQGSDGDYNGGTKVKYQSKDMGKTWKFVEEFIPKAEPWEG